MSVIKNSVLYLTIALVLMLTPSTAYSLTFEPTEAEWLTWPDYCRARYLVSGAGWKSHFAGRVSSAEIVRHERQMGKEVWHWLHHHCAGLVYLSRASNEKKSRSRNLLLEKAESNVLGQYARTPRNHWFFPEVAIALAQIHRIQGNITEALGFIDQSIVFHPKNAQAYSLASIIYEDSGDLRSAREILLKGDLACGGSCAEIHYFLGLLYLQEGNLELATAHARKAYSLGYPLAGLRIKLEKLGQNLEI